MVTKSKNLADLWVDKKAQDPIYSTTILYDIL